MIVLVAEGCEMVACPTATLPPAGFALAWPVRQVVANSPSASTRSARFTEFRCPPAISEP